MYDVYIQHATETFKALVILFVRCYADNCEHSTTYHLLSFTTLHCCYYDRHSLLPQLYRIFYAIFNI